MVTTYVWFLYRFDVIPLILITGCLAFPPAFTAACEELKSDDGHVEVDAVQGILYAAEQRNAKSRSRSRSSSGTSSKLQVAVAVAYVLTCGLVILVYRTPTSSYTSKV